MGVIVLLKLQLKLKSSASFDKTRVIALTTSFSIKRKCVKTILLKIANNNKGNNLKEQKLKTLISSIAVNINFSKYKIINNIKIMILKSGDLPELGKIYRWQTNKILILGEVGWQCDQITAASWSGNTCQPTVTQPIPLIGIL